MDELKLENGRTLLKTIKNTKENLRLLINLKKEKEKSIEKRQPDNKYDDGLYTLNIGQYDDMSGGGGKLTRYGGNMELLNVIIETLENQLNAYEKEFEAM